MADDTQVIAWLRQLAERGGKGVVDNIDARCLGRIADRLAALAARPSDAVGRAVEEIRNYITDNVDFDDPQTEKLMSGLCDRIEALETALSLPPSEPGWAGRSSHRRA